MLRRTAPLSIIVLIALAIAACSKSSSPDKTSSIADAGAAPIDPLSRTLSLDQPDHGVQIGTPEFPVANGQERQWCYYFKLPSDVDLDIVKFQIRFLAGSHHMNLFQTDKDVPDHDEDCFARMPFTSNDNPHGVDLVVGSQSTSMDWALPAGVGFKLKAHRQLILQTHYVNAGTQHTPSGFGKVLINLVSEPDPTKITAHMGTMFANNVNIHIPPRENRSFSTTCGLPKPVKLAALTGHFHSRGKIFSVNLAPNGADPTDEIYRSRAWDEPPFKILAQPVDIPAGGGLYYTCDFQNASDLDIKFGPRVDTDEHCNLFAYFYPWEDDKARYCF
jgi:Copper type II ascorbate-dependent monooxygenase, C-terminal domain